MAETLDAMGVDVIEAGFAQASNGDFESVREIASRIKNSVVCSLARAKSIDIERAAEAIKPAKRGRIHQAPSAARRRLPRCKNGIRKRSHATRTASGALARIRDPRLSNHRIGTIATR